MYIQSKSRNSNYHPKNRKSKVSSVVHKRNVNSDYTQVDWLNTRTHGHVLYIPLSHLSQTFFITIILSFHIIFASSGCPNLCSGHGDCTSSNRCNCWRADKVHDTYWIGGDCSMRQCPRDIAWQDVATGNDVAHNIAECSNAGM